MGLDVFGVFVLPGSELMWGLLLGVVPEVLVGLLLWNRRLRKKLRAEIRADFMKDVQDGELDPAITRATKEVREDVAKLRELVEAESMEARIESVQGKLTALDEALGVKFSELEESLKGLPERVRMSALGAEGIEAREIYKAANLAEEDVEEYVMEQADPLERVALKVDTFEPSDDYKDKHPAGNLLIQGVKEFIKLKLGEARAGTVGNVVNMVPRLRGGRRGEFG